MSGLSNIIDTANQSANVSVVKLDSNKLLKGIPH